MVHAKAVRWARPEPDRPGRTGHEAPPCGRPTGDPLAFVLTEANAHGSAVFDALVDAVPPIRQRRGRPRKRPAKLHADKGYDYARCRSALSRRRIRVRIARRGVESSARLGRPRWVVERARSWLSGSRRLLRAAGRRPRGVLPTRVRADHVGRRPEVLLAGLTARLPPPRCSRLRRTGDGERAGSVAPKGAPSQLRLGILLLAYPEAGTVVAGCYSALPRAAMPWWRKHLDPAGERVLLTYG